LCWRNQLNLEFGAGDERARENHINGNVAIDVSVFASTNDVVRLRRNRDRREVRNGVCVENIVVDTDLPSIQGQRTG
jgi:hypothetical protein